MKNDHSVAVVTRRYDVVSRNGVQVCLSQVIDKSQTGRACCLVLQARGPLRLWLRRGAVL